MNHVYKVVYKTPYGYTSSYDINPEKIAYTLRAWSHASPGTRLFAFTNLKDVIEFNNSFCGLHTIFKCMYRGEPSYPEKLVNNYQYADEFWGYYHGRYTSINACKHNIIQPYKGTVLVDALRPIEIYNQETQTFEEYPDED